MEHGAVLYFNRVESGCGLWVHVRVKTGNRAISMKDDAEGGHDNIIEQSWSHWTGKRGLFSPERVKIECGTI